MIDDAYPGLGVGAEARLETRGDHVLAVTATREVGRDTGRRRYRVICRTCRVVVHPATTGPRQQMEAHLRDVAEDGHATPFPGTSLGEIE